jgi:hypothetical protein
MGVFKGEYLYLSEQLGYSIKTFMKEYQDVYEGCGMVPQEGCSLFDFRPLLSITMNNNYSNFGVKPGEKEWQK